MGRCTKCGHPNEYVDGPYLCYQCKLFTEVFCGVQDQVEVSKPEPQPEPKPKVPSGLSPWATVTHDERERARLRYGGTVCDNCGAPWGDHRMYDWHCPDPFGGYYLTQWFEKK